MIGERAAGREQRGERAHRVGGAARGHAGRGVDEHACVRGAAVRQRLHEPRELVARAVVLRLDTPVAAA